MIEKINITGYKSIKQMNLDLKPINIFIGANGSGKSNFISYFKLVKNLGSMLIRVGEIDIVSNQCERTICLPFGVRTGTGTAPAKQMKDGVSQSNNMYAHSAEPTSLKSFKVV